MTNSASHSVSVVDEQVVDEQSVDIASRISDASPDRYRNWCLRNRWASCRDWTGEFARTPPPLEWLDRTGVSGPASSPGLLRHGTGAELQRAFQGADGGDRLPRRISLMSSSAVEFAGSSPWALNHVSIGSSILRWWWKCVAAMRDAAFAIEVACVVC